MARVLRKTDIRNHFVGSGRFTGIQTPIVAAVGVPEPETRALLAGSVPALGL